MSGGRTRRADTARRFGGRSPLRAVALGVGCASVGALSAAEAHAQVRLLATGTLTVEGRAVARLAGVPLQRVRWRADRRLDVALGLGGLRASGALDREEATLELVADRPMAADVASDFTLLVRAGARLPVYAHERGRTYVALPPMGLPGIQGLSAFHDGAAALLMRPAPWPASLPAGLRTAGAVASPGGRHCAALTLHARPDARSETLAVGPDETLHVTGHRGPWTELWVERPELLLRGWTRARMVCEVAGVGGLGLSGAGSGGFDPPTPVTLPRGLRFGATAASRTPWLVVGAATPALRYWEDDGPHYRVGEGGATLTFAAPVLGPRLRYVDDEAR